MNIIRSLIKAVRKTFTALKTKETEKIDSEVRLWVEEWRITHDSSREMDEILEQERLDYLAEYGKQCREESLFQEQRMKEILEAERLGTLAEIQHPICAGCHKVWCQCIQDPHDDP